MSDQNQEERPAQDAVPRAEMELTLEQRDAFYTVRRLCERLQTEAQLVKENPDVLCQLDDDRFNQVVLIDGERGTGKTTVLLSVLRFWNENLKAGIFPVGIIDLQPLPKSTTLLLHVASQLARVVERLEIERGEPPNDGGRRYENNELASRTAWRELLRAVAAGWGAGVQSRRATLDVESYALELEDAERRRLDVPSRFREFVNRLVDDFNEYSPVRGTKVCFVVAIDDADMNPVRCFELLNVVRILWHPHIIFAMTGDLKLFRHLAANHFLSQMKVADHDVSSSEFALAEKLGRQFIEKVVPLRHRARSLEMAPDMRFHRLRPELERVEVHQGYTLGDCFWDCQDYVDALPKRFRSALTLEASWDEIRRDIGVEIPWAWVVWSLWKAAVQESMVPGVDGETLMTMISPHRDGGLAIRSGVPNQLEVFVRAHSEELARTTEASPIGFRIVDEFRFVFASPMFTDVETTNVRHLPELPERLSASLLVAHDLTLRETGRVSSERFMPTGRELWFAAVSHGEALHSFAWPFPAHLPFAELLRIASNWRVSISALAPGAVVSRKDVGGLARRFVVVMLGDTSANPSLAADSSWGEIVASIPSFDKVTRESARSEPRLYWAARQMPLLACPELGLPSADSNALLDALLRREDWQSHQQWVVRERHARAEKILGDEMPARAFLEQQDDISWSHRFSAALAPRTERRAITLRRIQQLPRLALRASGNLREVFGYTDEGNNLRGYFASEQRYRLLEQTGTERLRQWVEANPHFAQITDSLPLAMDSLWRTVAEELPDSANALSVVSVQHGELVVAPIAVTRDVTRIRALRSRGIDAREVQGPALNAKPPMPALAELVYRIAHDVAVDAGDESASTNTWETKPMEFEGMRFRRGDAQEVNWLVPRLHAFIDEELFNDAWNRVLGQAVGVLESTSPASDPPNLRDVLAYALIEISGSILGTRRASVNIRVQRQPGDWASMVRGQQRPMAGDSNNGLRARCQEQWARHVGVYAIPEFGLSFAAAEGILEGIPEETREFVIDYRARNGLDAKSEIDSSHPFNRLLQSHR